MTTERVVPPSEIVEELRAAGAVLLDDPSTGPRCPITNAYHRITVPFKDIEWEPNQVLADSVYKGMRNMLYKAIFTRFKDANIHDCQLQVWSEPCITMVPFRVRCDASLSKVDGKTTAHIHVYARVTYAEESLFLQVFEATGKAR